MSCISVDIWDVLVVVKQLCQALSTVVVRKQLMSPSLWYDYLTLPLRKVVLICDRLNYWFARLRPYTLFTCYVILCYVRLSHILLNYCYCCCYGQLSEQLQCCLTVRPCCLFSVVDFTGYSVANIWWKFSPKQTCTLSTVIQVFAIKIAN